MTKYKKFDCIKCGHSWLGYAKKPKCRNCKSKMVNSSEAIIDDKYLSDLKQKAGVQETKKKLEKKISYDKLEEQPIFLRNNDNDNIFKGVEMPKIENVKMDNNNKDEIDENLFYGSPNVETKEEVEPEEVVYKCSCGADLNRGALFCTKCGSALDINWNDV